jgi:ABC-type sugar transport system ATPase subunit
MNFFTATVERRDAGLAAVVAEVVIPLDPSALIDDIAQWVGRAITVGVRAESITAAPRHEGSPRLTGTVEFVEELGSEVIVHTRVAGLGASLEVGAARSAASDDPEVASTLSNLVTKLPAHSSCRPGDTVTLFIDPANVHCFDPAGPSLRKGILQ